MHSPHTSNGRALVLGGGGAAGNAWEIGVLAGLAEGGTDVTDADVVIGTSAGATVAAQIGAVRPLELLAAILAQPSVPPAGAAGHSPTARAAAMMDATAAIIAAAGDPADMRRRLGAAAVETAAVSPARRDQWRDTVAARLPAQDWPERRVLIVAVDAETGEPVTFDRDSGVDLADAVAASCSNGFAYRIGDRRYFDGGYRRSSENADLAAGYGRVLVLSPFGGRSRMPPEWNVHLAAQVDELRAGGSRVETVVPDVSSRELFGANAADPSARPRAARAGHDQGKALAEQVAELWR